MHCGSGRCVLESCTSFVRDRSTLSDGRSGIVLGSSQSDHVRTAMAMGVLRGRNVSLRRRAIKRIVCDDGSSRRISYKRGQQPPSKGFPSTHDADVLDAHRNHHDRQKARAFEFSCENEDTSSINRSFNLPRNLVSDGSWSSRILMQVY